MTAPAPMPVETIFRRAIAAGTTLYALLDAAREPAGRYELRRAGLEHKSLFAGAMGDKLKEVAPCLIEFPPRSPFRPWWFEQWGNSIGVLVEAPVSLEELRRHFRTLTIVRDDARKRYYFRFYDPRVLRVFLPACTTEELKQFFGPISAFYCEGPGGSELLAFSLIDDKLSLMRRPIPQGD